ncbi:hypothetical protein [Nostoc sp.]|uniref:hypothetical protein n=1 Tax=Nostoc sp. TaxID=1180 RepID=UPI002FF74225
MQALPQFISLQNLESVIDYLLLLVVLGTPLLDAIALMVAWVKSVLVYSSLQVVGSFTKHYIVRLIAYRSSLKTANIFEVMHTLSMILSKS